MRPHRTKVGDHIRFRHKERASANLIRYTKEFESTTSGGISSWRRTAPVLKPALAVSRQGI
jgi:hypothetical protein